MSQNIGELAPAVEDLVQKMRPRLIVFSYCGVLRHKSCLVSARPGFCLLASPVP